MAEELGVPLESFAELDALVEAGEPITEEQIKVWGKRQGALQKIAEKVVKSKSAKGVKSTS